MWWIFESFFEYPCIRGSPINLAVFLFSSVQPHLSGQLTNIRRSDGAPEPDGALKVVTRKKIIHYRQLYLVLPEPIAFMPVGVDTSGRIYDDFLRLLFLHAHRESSALTNDIPEESGQFRFLRAACFTNIKVIDDVGCLCPQGHRDLTAMWRFAVLYFLSRKRKIES